MAEGPAASTSPAATFAEVAVPVPLAGPLTYRVPPEWAGTARAEEQMVTEVEAMKVTAQALQYTDVSAKPDQTCANCQFYTAGDGAKGKCQLFPQGLVAEAGWCMSWTKKLPTP